MSVKKEEASSELAALFMDVVPRAMREYRKEVRGGRGECVSVPQFRVLAKLRNGPLNIRALSEHQGVSIAAMSRMVDYLCRHKLVERSTDKNDRRQVLVRATKKGAQIYQRAREDAKNRFRTRLATMSAVERRKLNQGLVALARAVDVMGESLES